MKPVHDTWPLRFAMQVFCGGQWVYLLPAAASDANRVPSVIQHEHVTAELARAHRWTQRGGLTAHQRAADSLKICGYRVRSVAVRGWHPNEVVDEAQTREY